MSNSFKKFALKLRISKFTLFLTPYIAHFGIFAGCNKKPKEEGKQTGGNNGSTNNQGNSGSDNNKNLGKKKGKSVKGKKGEGATENEQTTTTKVQQQKKTVDVKTKTAAKASTETGASPVISQNIQDIINNLNKSKPKRETPTSVVPVKVVGGDPGVAPPKFSPPSPVPVPGSGK